MRYLFTIVLLLTSLLLQAQWPHPNILIGGPGYDNEPSIALDPDNPMHLVAGANLNNVYWSSDGGWTWSSSTLTSPYGVWGDPVIISGLNGRFYYFHLSNPPSPGQWIDRIVCQYADSIAGPWSAGTYMGLNLPKVQDKEWGIVDRSNGNIYVSWTQFDEYDSYNPLDSSVILFSRSLDQGLSWSNPVRLSKQAGDCVDSDNTTEGAVPAVGPNGEVYVAWSGPAGIRFDRSTNGGISWLENDILVADHIGGWDQSVPGIYRCNGMPITLCDTGSSAFHGSIYVCWGDERAGAGDLDVWVSRSSDQGNTWSSPVRVNQDSPGKMQFFPWMAVDPVTGHLWVVFYDRRNHSNTQTDVYLARSTDGGLTWTDFRISENPFLPNSNVFFGDYTHIVAYNDVVRPIWTRMDNGNNSVYTAMINTTVVGLPEAALPLAETEAWPNPASNEVFFSFKLRHPAKVSLQLIEATGRQVATIYDDQLLAAGKYVEHYPVDMLAEGLYSFVLRGPEGVMTRKIVVRRE
ncbi:MAG TPA: exo-alpha-sialidase [Bacteroidales bacterium]|nr:exo-alpha-sialidase [Bacteroidales bacterium]